MKEVFDGGKKRLNGRTTPFVERLALSSISRWSLVVLAEPIENRDAVERLPGDPGVGGMPTRVKCLHVLVAHSLAVGPGVNPLGDEGLAMLPRWGSAGPCVEAPVDGR